MASNTCVLQEIKAGIYNNERYFIYVRNFTKVIFDTTVQNIGKGNS